LLSVNSFCLIGCGVKTYPFLSPPLDSSIFEPLANDKLFKFYNYTNNNTNYFLGYEIYYKFYSLDKTVSKYESETELIELTPTHDKLVSLGYTRIYNRDDVFSLPLIPIDSVLAEEDIPIEIDFRFLTETIFPEIKYSESRIDISRYVKKGNDIQNNLYNFIPELIGPDYEDISSSIVNENTESLYLSLYVLSYGKYDVFKELYSKTAHLGKISLQTQYAF